MPLPQLVPENHSGMADESSDHDEDDFKDAEDTFSMATEADILSAIRHVSPCWHLFLNNQILDAINSLKPWHQKSMYHALGMASLQLLQSLMTYDPKDIELACNLLTEAAEFCNKFRHKSSISNNTVTKIMKRPNYNTYTEEEVHAELIHAELLVLWSVASVIHSENLLVFIKVGWRLRSSYISYKECFEMLEHRNWSNPDLKMHFKSGVLLGLGTFNLIISMLPSKFRKLLGVVGFGGNGEHVSLEFGCSKLDEGLNLREGLRAPLCSLAMLAYSTVICFAISTGKIDVEYNKSVVKPLHEAHPKGTIVLYFMARIEHIQGNVSEAIAWLNKSLSSQDEWKQFKFLCFWELQWCYGALGQWRQQAHYVRLIKNETQWSKTVPYYMYASALFMCNDLTKQEQEEIVYYMKLAPTVKRRIAGHSLPMEKFYCKKAQRFIAQNEWLFLPAVEMMYTWNYFIIAGKNRDIMTKLLATIDRALSDVMQTQSQTYYYVDNYCLGVFLKGMCLKYLNSPLSAEECFQAVCQNYAKLRDDKHLVPWALFELGQMNMECGNYNEALKYLRSAKNDYTKYALESRLHFKVHACLSEIKSKGKLDICQQDSHSKKTLPYKDFADDLTPRSPNSLQVVSHISSPTVTNGGQSSVL